MKLTIKQLDFEKWLIEKGKQDDSFFSRAAVFLLSTLCHVSQQDLMLMLTFLHLDCLYERLSINKMLADERILKGKTAASVVTTAMQYLREYALSFHKFSVIRELEDNTESAFESRLEDLRKLYSL